MAEYDAFASVVPGMAFLAAFFLVFLIMALVVYVYTSLALMFIAKKMGYKYPGLMWIPGVNLALIFHLGDFPWWLAFGLILTWIPILGWIINIGLLVLAIIAYYKICEKLGKPGWWGILIGLIPIVNWILLGILAWGSTSTPAPKK